MTDWIQNLMDSMGYLGILLLMVLENIFPPIPSELIMPSAGFAAARGDMTLGMVILMGTLGSVIGTLPLYYIGRAFGEDKLVAWADKHGKWLTLSGKDIRKADDWFDRHGNKAVLFGRMVPGIRSLLSLPAGMSEMPLPKFLIYSAIGSALWSAALAYAGYALGENYDRVEQYVGPASKIILGVVVVGAIVWFIRRKREQGQGG
ncbi:DedA family protein [Deinococcus wulumuqiensis]|uniref:Alkaline phosphatase n=1 Tax=Deinococcus wulumuqiensis TaxID=980427 RepID=A0AAV4K2G4_9DEIO|nr:DedA family protein [Deinococcus wulumuqiensis]QII21337.1 DedA family protein [Deinococcus wulumuqiensis R12]GGI78591.1 alkaline phosphatase [Deinococcus wulumuqiensis]GGP30586.1 alkaline phosphatase [Deinococcus wulumuqiensis]